MSRRATKKDTYWNIYLSVIEHLKSKGIRTEYLEIDVDNKFRKLVGNTLEVFVEGLIAVTKAYEQGQRITKFKVWRSWNNID